VRPCAAAVIAVNALHASDDCMDGAGSRSYHRARLAVSASSARPDRAGSRGSWRRRDDDTRLFVGTARPCDPVLVRDRWASGAAI
jgi:hypothetical protein